MLPRELRRVRRVRAGRPAPRAGWSAPSEPSAPPGLGRSRRRGPERTADDRGTASVPARPRSSPCPAGRSSCCGPAQCRVRWRNQRVEGRRDELGEVGDKSVSKGAGQGHGAPRRQRLRRIHLNHPSVATADPTPHVHHRRDGVQIQIGSGQREELALAQTRRRRGQQQHAISRGHPRGDLRDLARSQQPFGEIAALHTQVRRHTSRAATASCRRLRRTRLRRPTLPVTSTQTGWTSR